MKRTLIIFVLFPILVSFNSYGGWFDKTVCVETDAQERGGIVYLPNETEPFTGKNLCEYENGQYKSQGKLKDGKQDGKSTGWYENGQIRWEGNFKDGKEDGKWTWWYENGQIQEGGNYKDGKLDGKFTQWNKDGQIKAEVNYKDGKGTLKYLLKK
jgi:antitoxin component YwqK of YwqJK toxin-antitoxin module